MAAIEAEQRINTLVLEAIDLYLNRGKSDVDMESKRSHHLEDSRSAATEIPKEHQKWVAYLLYILTEQNDHATAAIKSNLEAFTRLTQLDGRKDAPPPDEPIETTVENALELAKRATENAEELNRGDCDVRPSPRRVRPGRNKVA